MLERFSTCVGVVAMGVTVVGCGGAHDAMRGDQPKAADVMGEANVQPIAGPSAPLVVDWKSEQRGDLEEIVADGALVVVAWDAKGFRLLPKCRTAGDYGYVAIGLKTDVVHFKSADEVTANLPLGGLGIAGKIGADFSKGATLDIAMAMVGKRRTTLSAVPKSKLEGECAEATHYVRAMTLGAFAMSTGTEAHLAAAAEIFGAGTEGTSGSAKNVATADGVLTECQKSTGDEEKPLGQCHAVLRLELEPLDAGGGGAKKHDASNGASDAEPIEKADVKVPDCQGQLGLVWNGTACVKGGASVAHACKELDGPDCKAQCELGDRTSCWQYGWYKVKVDKDLKGSIQYYMKGCSGTDGLPVSCFELAYIHDKLGHDQEALNMFNRACKLGNPEGCRHAGQYYASGKGNVEQSKSMAAKQYRRGCDGGDGWSCSEVAAMYATGDGIEVDLGKAALYGKRGCLAGDEFGCKVAAKVGVAAKDGSAPTAAGDDDEDAPKKKKKKKKSK